MPDEKKLNQRTDKLKQPRKIPLVSVRRIFYPLLFFIFFTLVSGVNSIQAQMLYVQQNDDVQREFALNEVTKLTFPSGTVEITQADGSADSFSLENLHFLSFVDFNTGTITSKKPEVFNVSVYPNPAGKWLNINYDIEREGRIRFIILDLQGRALLHKETTGYAGKNKVEVDIGELPKGMYFLKMKLQQKTITTKLIKQ